MQNHAVDQSHAPTDPPEAGSAATRHERSVGGPRGSAGNGQAGTRLHQLVTCVVEPRQLSWLRKLGRSGSDDLGNGLVVAIARGLRLLESHSPQEVIEAAAQPQPRPLGSRMVACALDAKVAARLAALVTAGGADPGTARALPAHAVRTAYLAAHPDEPEVQPPPPPSPLAAIFRPLPPPPPAPVLPSRSNGAGPRKALTGRAAPPPGSAAARLRALLGDQSLPAIPPQLTRSAPRISSRSSGPPPLSPEDEAELATGPLFTTQEIRKHREALGLSQARLARALGVSRGLIAEAERGRRSGERTLQRLTAGLRRLMRRQNGQASPNGQDQPAKADGEPAEQPAVEAVVSSS